MGAIADKVYDWWDRISQPKSDSEYPEDPDGSADIFDEPDDGYTSVTPKPSYTYKKRDRETVSNIVNIAGIQARIEARHPAAFSEAGDIRELVKSNIVVIVNLDGTDKTDGQRLIDYLSGVADAINGSLQCISNRAFVIAPAGVTLGGDFKESYLSEGISYSFLGE
jgi:cell division inhibitor SepF